MATKKPNQNNVDLPSADLIVFRFDNIDSTLIRLEQTMKDMALGFMHREEGLLLKKDSDEKIENLKSEVNTIKNDKKWLNRAIVAAALSGAFLSIFTFLFTLVRIKQ